MFIFGDIDDHGMVDKVEQAGNSRLSTNRRQSQKYQLQSRQSTLSSVLATVDFVVSVYRALESRILCFQKLFPHCHFSAYHIGHPEPLIQTPLPPRGHI